MPMRSDAAFAMFNFAIALAEKLRAAGGPESVWNFGIVAVRPGAGNVVPAEADLTVEFRDAAADVIERMEEAFHAGVRAADGSYNVAVSSTPNARLEPAAMDAALMDDLAAAAADVGASFIRMPSGAGHDAMVFAPRIPSAMMFVPSIDGRSHDVSENTSEADIRRGLRVFTAAVSRTLARLNDVAASQSPPSYREKERAS
jgi:beta-ureidopropionase / N-carbamoyl-L-amino-acid hydrolase